MVTPAPAPRRVMVAFGALAAVVVGAGFMAVQFAPRAATPPAVNPSPVAVDYGPPPPGVQLVWVQDPNHPGWLIGYDWSGNARGTVKVQLQPQDQFAKLSQAPDGSGFAYSPIGKGGYQVFLDRLGHPIANQDLSLGSSSEIWADDSRHLCTLGGGLQWNLGVIMPGQAPDVSNVVALDPAMTRSGIIAVSLAACSLLHDRAVVVYSYTQRPTEYFVVRISDGAILEQRIYSPGRLANAVASTDGTLIAENSGTSTGQTAPGEARTAILRASDLSVVQTLDPTIAVIAFSGDDSTVLVSTAPLIAGQPEMLAVLDLRTASVMWRGQGTAALSALTVQPAGNLFAIALTQPGQEGQPATVLMIHGDGSRPAKLPGLFVPAW